MILPGTHDSLPISMSKDQPEYMCSIRIMHSILLPSAKPFMGQRSGTHTIVLHSSGHSIPFHSSPVQSVPPFHSTVPVHRIHTPLLDDMTIRLSYTVYTEPYVLNVTYLPPDDDDHSCMMIYATLGNV